MDQSSPVFIPPRSAALPDTRLHGAPLTVARALWVTFFALNLIWFGLAIGPQVATTLHPCLAVTCTLTPTQAALFHHLGIGLGTVAAYYIGLPALIVVAAFIVAALLFWRRSDDWLALMVGLFLFWSLSTFVLGPSDAGVAGPPALSALVGWADGVIFYAVLLLFPDGRFVPRWAWVLLAVAAIQGAAGVLTNGMTSTGGMPTWLVLIWGLAFPVGYLSALGVQVYRYRRVSNARQRQQTKWVVFGFAVALIANVLYWIVLGSVVVPLLPPALHGVMVLYPVVAYPLFELALTALPVSFVIAIQRHQLFDVDTLIRRTLVYGSLSLILAALYFSLVLGAQAVTERLSGQSEPAIVLVASTLLIAALVNPVRHRLQALVDRRFYRSKYDAARTLEAFGETLRITTDVRELSQQLLAVVQETMQPVSVSLWLREALTTPRDERTGGSD
jgi:hypothetical protein